jgi:hypothetical protein
VERSLARVARDTGRQRNAVEQLSRRNAWVPRAQAWDAENERIKRNAQIAELEVIARRQVLAGQLLMAKGLTRIKDLTDVETARLSVSEAIRLVETGARLERLGHGEPGDLDQPYVERSVVLTGGETPIMEILRRNPSRVGPVVEILAKLQEALPELVDGEPDAEVDDEELAYFLDDPEAPEDS